MKYDVMAGDFIMHEKMEDVCFEVFYSYFDGSGVEFRGLWWNLGFDRSWQIGPLDWNATDDFMRVKQDDLKSWKKLVFPKKNQCLRSCEWAYVDVRP